MTDKKPIRFYLILLCLWTVFSYCMLAYLHVVHFPMFMDFVHLLTLADSVSSGQCAMAYDYKTHLGLVNQRISPVHLDGIDLPHLPIHQALLALILVALPTGPAYLVFCLASFGIGIWTIWKILPAGGAGERFKYLLLVFSSFPSLQSLWFGQVTWFLFSILAFLAAALRENRRLMSQVALIFLSLKFQYLPAFAAGQLIRFGLKGIAIVIPGVLAVALLDYLILGLDGCSRYLQCIGSPDPKADLMVSFLGLSTLVSGGSVPLALQVLMMTAGLGIIVLAWLKAKSNWQEGLKWAVSLTVLISLLFSPHSHAYDAMLALIPVLITLPYLTKEQLESARCFRIWNALGLSFPVITWAMFIFNLCAYDGLGWYGPGVMILLSAMTVTAACCLRRSLMPTEVQAG